MHGDGPGVSDQSARVINRAFGESDRRAQSPAIRALRHEDLLAGIKTDAALRGGNSAVVFDAMGDEESRAAIPDVDLAIVDNAGRGRRRIELPGPAASKVQRGSRSGRHQEAMRVENGLAANVKARLVLQHHVAVGVEGAEDLRGVRIVDLVPDHRRG